MYLSIENGFKLDKIVKSFEVAYRSFIVSKLCGKYNNQEDFQIAIEKIDDSFDTSSIILSAKYKTKIKNIRKNIERYYQKIVDCNNSYKIKDYDKIVVPYVSEIIDYVIFFYNPLFTSLSNGFSSIEYFKSLNIKYNHVRNDLSHLASSKITIENAKITLNFLKKINNNIPDCYHWFVQKRKMNLLINELSLNIESFSIKIHNLSDVSFSHQRLYEREDELSNLENFIFGKEVGYRKSGSVAVYGYGGVGKTALVLEFLYRVAKGEYDQKLSEQIDFLLFFSSKDEVLSYTDTTKKLYIRDINKQINSFDNFTEHLFSFLEVKEIEELNQMIGIIVIDNFETLKEPDKLLFFDFIKKMPRTIQFIITSRNEELCEDKINLKEFVVNEKGKKFIEGYAGSLTSNISLNDNDKIRLLELSKGNPLIIVLSLQLLSDKYNLQNVIDDLESVESGNIDIISDFMYKNTIGDSIKYLEENNYKPKEILKVVSLYNVPIDLYSLSKLSKVSVHSAEDICLYLSSKLILEKRGETFALNEFANKFIISKFIPNRLEFRKLSNSIRTHQQKLERKLEKLRYARKNSTILNGIMEDWKPKNSIDKIAISEAFSLFSRTKNILPDLSEENIKLLEKDFSIIEKMTSHPYIRFQKARCFQLIHKRVSDKSLKADLQKNISDYFENAIDTTDFYYPYIKNTKSYASLNWLYGLFISTIEKNDYKALRYLEDAILIFKKLKIKDKAYYTALNNLSWVYSKLYEKEGDLIYINELKPLYLEVKRNRSALYYMNFDVSLYLRNYSKYFK